MSVRIVIPNQPEGNPRRFRRDQSGLDGSFVLPNVSPGLCTIIAVENGADLDWAKPAVFARYLGHGQAITVRDQTKPFQPLPDPVEVQQC